jgi:hypothetical protein
LLDVDVAEGDPTLSDGQGEVEGEPGLAELGSASQEGGSFGEEVGDGVADRGELLGE